MSKIIKEVFENIFTGIIAIVLILGLVLNCILLISNVNSTTESQYLIRAENHKYYTDSYKKTEDSICFTDVRTKQNIIVYGNAVIEERIQR